MSLSFNAREIFDMGLQIEVNGKAFYEAAAKKTSDAALRELCRELADWEAGHVEVFRKLRDELPPGDGAADIYDPQGEAEAYLRALADSHVFLKKMDVAAMVAGLEGAAEIIDLALTFEKDSVVFYTGMKKVVPPHLGQARIDRLIEEEMKHIGMLTERKKLFQV